MALVVYTGNDVGVGTDDINTTSSSSYPTYNYNNYLSDSKKNGDKFVGLANQGATCYLNGLIQTLFMTPDFRKAVFTWEYNAEKDGSEELCIPLQLQKLFGQLHLKKSRVVDTVALTKSFGWEGFEVFQQQDVQELTRVLFDALEDSFRGTSVENVIDELYAGELIDYLRCIDVDYQSERIDKFLDFSLAIVPFGSNVPMKTLTECIEMFLRPEILDGENKYYAEKYDRKVDAIKGLKFGKLPQIMSVQLKRFVFDFSGDYVVQKKLNDQVKFPMILDMNKYLAKKRIKKQQQQSVHEDNVDASSCTATTTASSASSCSGNNVLDEYEEIPNEEFEKFLQEQMSKLKHESLQQEQSQSASTSLNPFGLDDDDYWNLDDPSVPPLVTIDGEVVVPVDEHHSSSANASNTTGLNKKSDESHDDVVYESLTEEQIQQLVEQKGEWVYELYAVLIHSGAISGGHYYAYIKDLSSKQWYNFNDSSVSLITEEEVREAWGGTYKSTASSYYYTSAKSFQSSSNAYMLMYRKVQREIPVISEESIPSYILNMVKEEEARQLQRQREEEELRNKLSVRVQWQGKEYLIPSNRKNTFHDLMTDIWYRLELNTVLKAPSSENVSGNDGESSTLQAVLYDRYRLRDYNSYTKITSEAYNYNESSHITLDDLLFSDYKVYIVETREEGEEWEVYYKDGLSLLIDEYDELTDSFHSSKTVRLPSTATMGDLKNILLQRKVLTGATYCCKEEIRVMKIVNVGYTDAKAESFDNDDRRLRQDLYIYDTMKLYVERRPLPTPPPESDKMQNVEEGLVSSTAPTIVNYSTSFQGTPVYVEESKALQTYISFRNRMEIRISYPLNNANDNKSNEYDNNKEGELLMNVDGRWKVRELRERIVKELQIMSNARVTSSEKCRLYKNSMKGAELKDGDMSLAQVGLYSGILVQVVEGDITPAGMFQINVKEFVAKDIIVGAMQLPTFPPPPPPPPAPPSLDAMPPIVKPVENWNDIDSIIDYDKSNTISNETKQMSNPLQTINIDDIDEDTYYETLTAARYKRAEAFSSVNAVPSNDTDDEDDNCSNQGNCDLSPDDVNEDTFFDGIDDSPVPSTAVRATSSMAGYTEIPIVEASAVAQVVESLPATSYAGAVAGCSQVSNRCYGIDDIAAMKGAGEAENGFFQDENAFPSLQRPSSRTSDVVQDDTWSNMLTDSAGLTPLSEGNIATETAKNLLDEDDGRVANGENVPPVVAPSDFGERTLNNSTTTTQIINIPGLDDLKIYAKPTMMVEELRDSILQALIQCGRLPEGTHPERIRLRERFASSVGKLFRVGKTLQQSGLYLTDNKGIVVQILDEDEHLPVEEVGDVVVSVQKFHRSTWTFSERIEILFPGSMSVQEISRGLSLMFDIPMDSLEALIVPRETTIYVSDVAQRAPAGNYGRVWFDPTKETKLMRYMSHDFRLVEGDLLLLQDSQEPLGELTEADKLSIQIVQQALNDKSTGYSYSWQSYSSTVPTWSDSATGTVKYPKTSGSSGGGGIRIKTHKDRLKEQNNNQSGDSTSTSVVASPTPTPGVGSTPSTSQIALNELDTSINNMDDKEFQKQGGYALFSDLQS